MARLVDHVNVHSSCIALLDIKGWKVRIEPGPYEKTDSRLDTYVATRDGTKLLADTPLNLLGLAALHEYHHPHGDESYWWWVDPKAPDLIDKIEDEALERSFFSFKERNFEGWAKCVAEEIRKSKEDPSTEAHERIGISQEAFRKVVSEHPELMPDE